jgi:DNA recombination protein RmuC
MMPNGDSIVVDSKVSLVAFEAFTNAPEPDEQAQHLRAHIASIRTHIKTLGGKEYHRHAGSGLDFVMMFVPIESAFSAAVTADPALFEYALDQGVLISTPTTLMSALRTIRNVWDTEKRHQNAEEIAARAGGLYDKVMGFLGSMDKLGISLDRAQSSYEDAKGQLSTGRGSVVRQVEMLRELGARSSKVLPAGWTGSEDGATGEPEPVLIAPEPADEPEDEDAG